MKPISLKALVFPQTMAKASILGGLSPWFKPVCFLTPPGLLESGLDAGLASAGLVESFAAPSPAGREAPGLAKLQQLLQDWELWLGQERGSGRAETMKAGIKPPPAPETVRGLMKDILTQGQPKGAPQDAPPEVTAELLLHLAHLQEMQAGDVEGLISQADDGRRRMSRLMGLEEEDALPEDYARIGAHGLPPFDFDRDEEHLLAQRMGAWALVAGEEPFAQAWPTASSLAAAHLLMGRFDRALGREEPARRSPAGAQEILSGPQGNPEPESGLAQEGVRLALPDLGGLSPAQLRELASGLAGGEDFAGLREGLAGILESIVSKPWSAELKRDLAQAARQTGHKAAELASGRPSMNLSIIVLPGLAPRGLPGLMREETEAGPAVDTGQGSCPLLVPWRE